MWASQTRRACLGTRDDSRRLPLLRYHALLDGVVDDAGEDGGKEEGELTEEVREMALPRGSWQKRRRAWESLIRRLQRGRAKPVAEGGGARGAMAPPHGENFCMEVRGDPYEKG